MNPLRVLSRARYRTWQFLHGLRPALAPSEIAEARHRLSAQEFAMFLAADARDRRHSVDLCILLERDGVGDRPASDHLLRAALLHDVGKGPLSVWDRVSFVLLNAALPPLARQCERAAAAGGSRWQDALWRLRHHAALGAALLEEAGSPPRVVEIVRRHTGPVPPDDPELSAFIRADDRV